MTDTRQWAERAWTLMMSNSNGWDSKKEATCKEIVALFEQHAAEVREECANKLVELSGEWIGESYRADDGGRSDLSETADSIAREFSKAATAIREAT